jgi:hypothetical protein
MPRSKEEQVKYNKANEKFINNAPVLRQQEYSRVKPSVNKDEAKSSLDKMLIEATQIMAIKKAFADISKEASLMSTTLNAFDPHRHTNAADNFALQRKMKAFCKDVAEQVSSMKNLLEEVKPGRYEKAAANADSDVDSRISPKSVAKAENDFKEAQVVAQAAFKHAENLRHQAEQLKAMKAQAAQATVGQRKYGL